MIPQSEIRNQYWTLVARPVTTHPLGIDFEIRDLPAIFLGLLSINDAVNDGMRNMDTLGTKFPRE